MEKQNYQFDDFLKEVEQDYKEFASKTNEALVQDGYKSKVESKASGFFVSYAHPKTKKSILNFLFRKARLHARAYANGFKDYTDLLDRMPESMEKEVSRAPDCKRLLNPEDCSPTCTMGYDFSIKKNGYKKCRYQCFLFEVNAESLPYLAELIGEEQACRRKSSS